MKVCILSFFLLLLAAPPQESGSIMPIFGKKGNGHACPVDGIIYTAAHNLEIGRNGFYWEDQYGREGRAIWNGTVYARDVIVLRIVSGGSPSFYKRGDRPKKGDKVHWYGYDQDPKKGLGPKRREAKVYSTRVGHIFFSTMPIPGDSGTCLLNEQDEVVGIVVFSLQLEKGDLPGAVDLSTKE